MVGTHHIVLRPAGAGRIGQLLGCDFQLLGASDVPAEDAYAAAGALWVAFTALYLVRTVGHGGAGVHEQLRHPLTGPLTAYIPVIAIWLVAFYAPRLGGAARCLCYTAVASLAVNAAALFAHWLEAALAQDAAHPGYFLPVVAGPFIASIGLATVGDIGAAVAAFGVGIYFWLLLGAVITGRLFFGSPPPLPVLSILLSPPGTASLAWFAVMGGAVDHIQAAIGAVTLFMLLIQLFF